MNIYNDKFNKISASQLLLVIYARFKRGKFARCEKKFDLNVLFDSERHWEG
jgi:hypothetical protein